jgi:hypothetical protein
MPDGGDYLWTMFLDLSRSRMFTEAGPLGIPYSEIDAWARLNARTLAPWEVAVLRDLDGAFLTVTAKLRRSQNGSKS